MGREETPAQPAGQPGPEQGPARPGVPGLPRNPADSPAATVSSTARTWNSPPTSCWRWRSSARAGHARPRSRRSTAARRRRRQPTTPATPPGARPPLRADGQVQVERPISSNRGRGQSGGAAGSRRFAGYSASEDRRSARATAPVPARTARGGQPGEGAAAQAGVTPEVQKPRRPPAPREHIGRAGGPGPPPTPRVCGQVVRAGRPVRRRTRSPPAARR